jgi:PKD repeat protein
MKKNAIKIISQPLIGFFTIALLAGSTARAQSIYSAPAAFVTIAGMAGNTGYADGTNGAAQFYLPAGIAEDTHNNLYVVDRYEGTIRMITPAGTNWVVTTIAGTRGVSTSDADGTNGAATFDDPVGIAVDTNGNLYVGENNGSTIRKITPVGTNWVVTTIAGQPENYNFADGTNGAALFNGPQNLTVDTHGNLYVADSLNDVIRKVAPVGTNWVVTTIAGQPDQPGYTDGTNNAASFFIPYGLALDGAGNLYVSDDDYAFGGGTVRKLTPAGTNWVVATIAGNGTVSGSADGTNSAALFNHPWGITVDGAGNIYLADFGNNTIRKIAPSGTNWVVSTIAGVVGMTGSTDGTGTNALFSEPWGATVDSAGNLFVTDFGNATVRLGLVPLPPSAAFSGTPTKGVAPLTVTFTNLSSDATNYVWNFGDGNMLITGSNTNVTDTYTNAGSYTVILTANGPGGASALTNTAYIVVTNPPVPVAGFSGTPTSGVAPMTVTFTNLSSNATNYVWNFGDGNMLITGSNTNVTETYTNAGTYTVVLTAHGPGGMNALTNTAYIVVTPPSSSPPVPNLTVQFAGGNSVVVSWPATGNFILQTNGSLTTPNWVNYGGAVTTSNGTNSVTIALPATGTLFFRLTNQQVQNPPVPVAGFSGTPTNGVAPMAVTFTNLSSNATNYVWNFGDGNMLITGSNTNVIYTYTNAGNYTVILTAYGPGGMNALTNTAYIVVTPPSSSPTVPNLTVRLAGGNSLVVSWPATGNFILQTNGSLTTPNWANYGGAVTTSNGTNSVTLPLPATGTLFFRLVSGQVQTVTVPNLMIGSAGLNSVVVSWPNTGSFTLQTNGNLTTPNWGSYGGTITTGNGTNSAAITHLPGSLFFRLAH